MSEEGERDGKEEEEVQEVEWGGMGRNGEGMKGGSNGEGNGSDRVNVPITGETRNGIGEK
jgi:hypothetical protein